VRIYVVRGTEVVKLLPKMSVICAERERERERSVLESTSTNKEHSISNLEK